MHLLSPFIEDLGIILICAGIVTVFCKRFKLPLVLGYILAGFIAVQIMDFTATKSEVYNIEVWTEIGSIFILFGLGLEFSFKKLFKVGSGVIITSFVELIAMLSIGFLISRMLGWTPIEGLFLGGMLTLSSSAIVVKNIEEMGLKKEPFVKYAMGVLIFEDLIAIVMLVLFGTISGSGAKIGEQAVDVLLRLSIFVVVWLMAGIFIIPTLLRRIQKYINNETLMIISIGLCLLMVIIAVESGFSPALGAFMMGSILAETSFVERINRITLPVRDFFAAIFFVSIGMLINPHQIQQYWVPITIISILFIIGKMLFTSLGLFLSGQKIQTSLRLGFSLTQIGEMAYILAAMGVGLNLVDPSIYPIVVSSSVITIFLTPYVMKLSDPLSRLLIRKAPPQWKFRLENSKEREKKYHPDTLLWKQLLGDYFKKLFIYGVILYTIFQLSTLFIRPSFQEFLSPSTSSLVGAVITLLLMSPFLGALMLTRKNITECYQELWLKSKINHTIIRLLFSFRIIFTLYVIIYTLHSYFVFSYITLLIVGLILLMIIWQSKYVMHYYFLLEKHFVINLNERQMQKIREKQNQTPGMRQIQFADDAWVDKQFYVVHLRIGPVSVLDGKQMSDLNFRHKYNLSVIRIKKSLMTLNIPVGKTQIHENDIMVIMGLPEDIEKLKIDYPCLHQDDTHKKTLRSYCRKQEKERKANKLICMTIPIEEGSGLAGKTLMESEISVKTRCLVIGLEQDDNTILHPVSETLLQVGDTVWVLGEEKMIIHLIEQNILT